MGVRQPSENVTYIFDDGGGVKAGVIRSRSPPKMQRVLRVKTQDMTYIATQTWFWAALHLNIGQN